MLLYTSGQYPGGSVMPSLPFDRFTTTTTQGARHMSTWIEFMIIALIVLAGLGLAGALIAYELAHVDIYFTMVPQGEIVAIMEGDQLSHFIGNIDQHWVDPKTGVVTEGIAPESVKQPWNFKGIYWMGFWPFARRYTYMFARNKYKKTEGAGTGYEIKGAEDEANSIFWRAQFGIVMTDAETEDGIPITASFVITTETINAQMSLFGNKSTGWLGRVMAATEADLRDFIAKRGLKVISEMQAETGGSGPGQARSDLQTQIELLNRSESGNPGLIETAGQEIKAINFLEYSVSDTLNETQKAVLARYFADRNAEKIQRDAEAAAEVLRIQENGRLAVAEVIAKTTVTIATAEAEAELVKLTARAKGAKLLSEATSSNPHAGTQAIADAIAVKNNLSTLILGQGVMPTVAVDAPKPEKKPEGST
jgi:hypothetical protein